MRLGRQQGEMGCEKAVGTQEMLAPGERPQDTRRGGRELTRTQASSGQLGGQCEDRLAKDHLLP